MVGMGVLAVKVVTQWGENISMMSTAWDAPVVDKALEAGLEVMAAMRAPLTRLPVQKSP